MSMEALRLGLVVDGGVTFDGSDYWTGFPMGRYCESVSRYFGRIDIYAPVFGPAEAGYESNTEFKLERGWATIIPLPGREAVTLGELDRQKRLLSLYFDKLRRNGWVVFFGPAGYRVAGIFVRRLQRRPYAVYFACDWDETARFSYRWGEAAGLKYWAYLKAGQIAQRMALQGTRFALTAGESLRERIAESGVPTYTTAPRMNLTKDDSFVREDTCRGDTITCLFTGSLIPRKGLTCLIEALAELREKGLPLVLQLAGEGEMRQELEKLVKDRGLTREVEFLGHVTNGAALWHLYRNADIFVLPTMAEGFPRVLYEAMSQSLPIVTTAVSGIPYTMRDRENALLVRPGDIRGLAGAIEELTRDPDLRRKLIAAGFETVKPILEKEPGAQLAELVKEYDESGIAGA